MVSASANSHLGLLDPDPDKTMGTMDSLWGTQSPLDTYAALYDGPNGECTNKHKALIKNSGDPNIVRQISDRLGSCANTGQPTPGSMACESNGSFIKRSAVAAGLVGASALLTAGTGGMFAGAILLKGTAAGIALATSSQVSLYTPIAPAVYLPYSGALTPNNYSVDDASYLANCFGSSQTGAASMSSTPGYQQMVTETLAPAALSE